MTIAKFIFVVMASLLCNLAYGLTSVTNAELSAEAEKRSLIIEFSSKAKFTVFSLANPDRLVIDLEEMDKRSVEKIFSTTGLIPGVSGFRIGTPLRGTTRLVLDLNKNLAQLNVSELSEEHGKERVLVRWEMPDSTVAVDKPAAVDKAVAVDKQERESSSIAETEVLWYLKAAEQANATAMYMYGMMYATGQGVPQNDKLAALWYSKAGNLGNASAQYRLGVIYANGDGVPQDYKKSVKWYRKAADQGESMAQFNLGAKYANGQGVPQDYKEAMSWYSKAAEQGLANAQNNLGLMFYSGQGVQQDLIQAYKWLTLASSGGNVMAVNNKKVAEANMTPKQIDEAQTLARNWQDLRFASTLCLPACSCSGTSGYSAQPAQGRAVPGDVPARKL